MFHHGITNIQLRYVLVFTMCANLLVMRLFEVATSLRYWNNLGCNCCYPPATCNPNETQFYILCWCGGGGVILATIFRLHPGKAGQNTTLQNPLAYAIDSSEIQTPQHTSCSHLNTSKIVLQKILTKSYKYRKSTESTDMRTIRWSTVSNPIEGTYMSWSSTLTGPSCGSWACSTGSGNLTSGGKRHVWKTKPQRAPWIMGPMGVILYVPICHPVIDTNQI